MIFSGFVCPVLLRHAADAAQGKKEGVGAVSCCVAHSSVRSAAHGTKKHRVPPGGLDVDRQQQHPTIGSKQDSQTPSPTGGTWPEIKKAQQTDRHQHEGEEGYMAVCCSKTQR